MFLKIIRLHVPGRATKSHDQVGVSGIQTHENGIFLYKSPQSKDFLANRIMDWFLGGCLLGALTGMSQFLLMPLFVGCLSMPRKIAAQRYFTFHAELLPHTEQVCFHKVTMFGEVERIYVDIRNLERIEADRVPSAAMLWD